MVLFHIFCAKQQKHWHIRWLYGGKLWVVFMILFNKSKTTTQKSSKQVCTAKTTSCIYFYLYNSRGKHCAISTSTNTAVYANKVYSWSLVSKKNINFHVLWQFWFNLRGRVAGAEYNVADTQNYDLFTLASINVHLFVVNLFATIFPPNSSWVWISIGDRSRAKRSAL